MPATSAGITRIVAWVRFAEWAERSEIRRGLDNQGDELSYVLTTQCAVINPGYSMVTRGYDLAGGTPSWSANRS